LKQPWFTTGFTVNGNHDIKYVIAAIMYHKLCEMHALSSLYSFPCFKSYGIAAKCARVTCSEPAAAAAVLQGGMVYSNAVTTVSPTYANEVLNGGAAGWLRSTLMRPEVKSKVSRMLIILCYEMVCLLLHCP
jgi:glycogen synthase